MLYFSLNYANPAYTPTKRILNLLDCTVQNRLVVLSQTKTLKYVNTLI